jgi:hypothetical protein
LSGGFRRRSANIRSAFDQTEYAGNAQTNFINYALAQNGTQAYVSADLGACAQAAAPKREWVLAAGVQGART